MEDKVNWGYWNFWLRYSQGSTQWLGKAAQKRAWNNKFYIKSSHQCQVLILTQNILWQKNWTDWAVLDYFSQISRTRVFCQDDLQWLGSYRLLAQRKSRKWIKVENCFVFYTTSSFLTIFCCKRLLLSSALNTRNKMLLLLMMWSPECVGDGDIDTVIGLHQGMACPGDEIKCKGKLRHANPELPRRKKFLRCA